MACIVEYLQLRDVLEEIVLNHTGPAPMEIWVIRPILHKISLQNLLYWLNLNLIWTLEALVEIMGKGTR